MYSGKNGSIRAKMVVFGQSYIIRAKVVVFGESGLVRAKLLYSGKSRCKRKKKGLYCCKVVELVQGSLYRAKWL